MIASEAYKRVVPNASVRAVLESEEAENWVIAGGAALAIASGCEIDHSDVDLFCIHERAALLPAQLALRLKAALEESVSAADCVQSVTHMAHTLRAGSLTLQVIRRPFASYEALFENFDLPCCEFAYDPRSGYMLASDRGEMSLRMRVVDRSQIRMHNGALVPAREAKYAARGFRFEGDFTPLQDARQTLLEGYAVMGVESIPLEGYNDEKAVV